MHWNHKKVSVLARHFSFLDMLLFSKGMGLKNDIFCLISFLAPLIAAKTSTNIWKQVGISQNPSQNPKSTKIRPLDQILAPLKRTNPCKFGLENWFFAIFVNFLPIFCGQWTFTPMETNQGITIPCWGYNQHHFWSCGTDFSPENGHIQPLKTGWKFRLLQFFQISSIFLGSLDLYTSGN